ncbi:phage head morphogenesis protein [Dyadobacter sp. CY261]|uniref:phage minor head protein n=1 Tax=Dyadobacter sp. CY261 TaxID=2907203 RepID=UPI001F2B7669|nr:phage minor head protein [Dyadobacter sp. CY261]MCF0074038.1 phage head morphogenesis protein [Dyadobacter sp. CY261]
MTNDERRDYWRRYARENAKYERNGVVHFRRAIAETLKPVIELASQQGAAAALASVDVLISRPFIEQAFIEFYYYVGTAHKAWCQAQFNKRKKKDRGLPPIDLKPVAAASADAGFGAGFFNPAWLQRLKNLVYGLDVASRVTSIANTLKKKLRAVLGRAVKEEVRPSAMARRIQNEMGGKFSEARARLIARTESTYVANVAAKQQAIETGLKLVKVWIDTRDSRVRDTHWKNPDPIGFSDKFKVGDALMDHPGDPAGGAKECCNCRCCVAYLPADDHEDIFPKEPIF